MGLFATTKRIAQLRSYIWVPSKSFPPRATRKLSKSIVAHFIFVILQELKPPKLTEGGTTKCESSQGENGFSSHQRASNSVASFEQDAPQDWNMANIFRNKPKVSYYDDLPGH
ncbi:hypothetical protein N7448_008899 [Penicillium atrosanguineum]|nr:hypothetical protein N7448_008899 [Penicillium atrosanguineum]